MICIGNLVQSVQLHAEDKQLSAQLRTGSYITVVAATGVHGYTRVSSAHSTEAWSARVWVSRRQQRRKGISRLPPAQVHGGSNSIPVKYHKWCPKLQLASCDTATCLLPRVS